MKKWIYIIILAVIIIGCKNNKDNYDSVQEIKKAFNVVLDSALNNTYYGKINYDIRGRFNYEYDDSLIYKSLECIDTIISENDIAYIIRQYDSLKGKDIDDFIDITHYYKKEGALYVEEDNIDYQFYLSPPLFTMNNEYFITYCIGTAIKPDSFKDGFYFLFINVDGEWHLDSIIKNDFTTPDFVSSTQSHSFVPLDKTLNQSIESVVFQNY